MSEKCDDKCYTSGKGCVLSLDGRCLHIFNNNNIVQKFSSKSYHTPKKEIKENKLVNETINYSIKNFTNKKPISGI